MFFILYPLAAAHLKQWLVNGILKIYKFKNEVGIDKKYWNKKWLYYSEKIPYFGIYYSIAHELHVINC